MILVTGASGNVGGAVLQEILRSKKSHVRAMYRAAADAKNVPAGAEPVIADFADPASLAAALQGVTSVFLVCAPIPQLVELETNMIRACKKAGIEHLVLNSALGAGEFSKSFPSWHTKVEEELKKSRLSYTILRPNGFMQNIGTYNAGTIKTQNTFYGSTGKGKIGLIDVRDIAALVAKIIGSREHFGKTYELNGPEALDNYQVAEKLTQLLKRPIQYVDIPTQAQGDAMRKLGMPDWQIKALLELQEYYAQGGAERVDTVAAAVLGRKLHDLQSYLNEAAELFQ